MSDKQNELTAEQIVVSNTEVTGTPLTAPLTMPALPEDPNDRLIMLAIQGNLDVDKLEKLIELKNRQEEREAKRDFDRHFAEMQARFEAAQRSKKGYNYKYAPIEELQKQFGPIIADHGFSYRWREEAIEGGKRCIMKISGWGHSEDNYFDIPNLDGTAQMNNIQVKGAMSTYGRRYSFIAGFGLIIEDEDTDGTLEDGVAYAEQIRKINAETTVIQASKTGGAIYKELQEKGDRVGMDVIKKVTTRRKEQLSKEGAV